MTTRTDIRAAVQRAFTVIPPAEAANHRWLTRTYETVIGALVTQLGGSVVGASIIDVGAGRGVVALALRFLGADVTACERYVFQADGSDMFHSADADALLATWKTHGVRPLIGSVLELPTLVGTTRFDAAVNIQVIEHLTEPKRMLDGIHAVLKPGGALVLSAPNYGRLQARLRLLFGKNPKLDLQDFYLRGVDGFIGHWREYLPDELTQMLAWSGFHEVRSTTFCDPWYPWEKRPSLSAAKDLVMHGLSKLIPGAQYELLSVSIKR